MAVMLSIDDGQSWNSVRVKKTIPLERMQDKFPLEEI